jgi:hypothetical protein
MRWWTFKAFDIIVVRCWDLLEKSFNNNTFGYLYLFFLSSISF